MVANFNMSWKSACLEILNYVCPFVSLLHIDHPTHLVYSSQNAPQVHSSKNEKHQWYGVSGPIKLPIVNVQIDNGHVDKLQKLRTTYLIGSYLPAL
jgi:hypothetical protein